MSSPGPLLVLAAGGKARPRRQRIPAPRESRLHTDVAKLLHDHALPDWEWRHISSKAKDAREGAILKRMGVNPGWPDFILVSPHGSVRFIELKRVGEVPSDAQKEFRLRCVKRGIPHVIARTIDQVLKVLDEWDVLRIKLGFARDREVLP